MGRSPGAEVLTALQSVGEVTHSGFGPLDVAAGNLDAAMIMTAPSTPWNLASFAAIVEAAGGAFSDIAGGADLNTNLGIFTNGLDTGPLRQSILNAIT